MALSQGNPALASDYNSVKNAIANAYRKTTGANASWNSYATVSSGTTMYAAAINELNRIGQAAANSYRASVSCTSNNGNSSNGSYCNNVRAGTFSVAYRYWRGQKCGGQMLKIKWEFLKKEG